MGNEKRVGNFLQKFLLYRNFLMDIDLTTRQTPIQEFQIFTSYTSLSMF